MHYANEVDLGVAHTAFRNSRMESVAAPIESIQGSLENEIPDLPLPLNEQNINANGAMQML